MCQILKHHITKVNWESGGKGPHTSLISTPDGDNCLIFTLQPFCSWKISTGSYCIGVWVGLKADIFLVAKKENLPLPGIEL
jgi:hypothetical protein